MNEKQPDNESRTGMSDERVMPTPHELWARAEDGAANNHERGERYRELMARHGYLVPRCAGHVGGVYGLQCELPRAHKGKHRRAVHIFDDDFAVGPS